ncbi:hypothetical protein EJB05_13267, partial [Eragrostis curvula]
MDALPVQGTVKLVFQPAEEGGAGAYYGGHRKQRLRWARRAAAVAALWWLGEEGEGAIEQTLGGRGDWGGAHLAYWAAAAHEHARPHWAAAARGRAGGGRAGGGSSAGWREGDARGANRNKELAVKLFRKQLPNTPMSYKKARA